MEIYNIILAWYLVCVPRHKLDVYGIQLGEKDVPKYLNVIKTLCKDKNGHAMYKQNLAEAKRLNDCLFEMIRGHIKEDPEDGRGSIFRLSNDMLQTMKNLKTVINKLEDIRATIASGYGSPSEYILHALNKFSHPAQVLIWADVDENGVVTLCCCPKNIGKSLHDQLWNNNHHYVLMSGTMSDGKSFDYFEKENGTNQIKKNKKQYSSTPSPFNYEKHTRLYLPDDLPMVSVKTRMRKRSGISFRIFMITFC